MIWLSSLSWVDILELDFPERDLFEGYMYTFKSLRSVIKSVLLLVSGDNHKYSFQTMVSYLMISSFLFFIKVVLYITNLQSKHFIFNFKKIFSFKTEWQLFLLKDLIYPVFNIFKHFCMRNHIWKVLCNSYSVHSFLLIRTLFYPSAIVCICLILNFLHFPLLDLSMH